MAMIKPLGSLYAPAGKLSLKPGADSIRFGAALSRKKDGGSNGENKRQLKPAPMPNKVAAKQALTDALDTVGYAKDPVSGSTKQIKTFRAPSATNAPSQFELAQQTRAKTVARTLVKMARPLSDKIKLGAFMSDQSKQTSMREGLAELDLTTDGKNSLDGSDDVPARDAALVNGLYVLASRQ